MKKLCVAKQVDGRWASTQDTPSGHVMYLSVRLLQDLLREHAKLCNSRVGGLLSCEEITHLELEDDGNVKIAIGQVGE